MDDTALAFGAIQLYRPETICGKDLARLMHTLIATERKAGGPYNTWLTDFKKDKRWDDCDIGVNANIAYMLSLLGVRLPNLTKYFEDALEKNALDSKYYFSPLIILYFISRSYEGDKKKLFAKIILKYQSADGTWGTPLQSAMAVTSLYRLSESIPQEERVVNFLLSSQANGYWKKESFYFERGDTNDMWYHGADVLTTSICLEAMVSLLGAGKTNKSGVSTEKHFTFQKEIECLGCDFIDRAQAVSKDFGMIARSWTEKIFLHPWTRDGVLLPFHIVLALIEPAKYDRLAKSPESHRALLKLSYAGLAGWIGYSLLDDVMDDDENTSLIPFANFCLREMNISYKNCISEKSFTHISHILDETDTAYFDEQKLRIPKIGNGFNLTSFSITDFNTQTAQKSLGYIISGLGTIDFLNEHHLLSDENSPIQKALVDFFHLYLKAKQDNDDAEDLIDDLSRGHITNIGAQVISQFKKKYPKRNAYEVSNSKTQGDKDELLSIFWDDVFPTLYTDMLTDIRRAAEILKTIPFSNADYFLQLLAKLKTSVEFTEKNRAIMQDFLKAY